MMNSRMMIPTLCLLAGVAAAQTPPPPPPPAAWDWDVPAPAAIPAPPAFPSWDTPPPVPAKPARPAFASWDAPPSPPRPARAPRALFAPQLAAPQPPQPPQPAQEPQPAPFPMAVPPVPPRPFHLKDDHFDFDYQIEQKMREAQIKLEQLDFHDLNYKIKGMADEYAHLGAKISQDLAGKFAFAPQIAIRRGQSDDRLYEAGKQALDNHRWDEAVESFTLVASRGGSHADGALYWKAYAQNKLGRRQEAQAAFAELRKTYPNSKWLNDVKVLELEIQQSSGRPVTPENQSDEELKLLALNGLMQSDPERALPLVETLLKSSQSLKIRKQAVYVLATSTSPTAQQLLEGVVRGTNANPDLQVIAIRYFGERRKANGAQVLSEVYSSSSDNYVKRAVLNAFRSYRDKDRLLQIAKTEKTPELRFEAIQGLRDMGGNQADLWQLYQTETTPEGKQQLLEMIPSAGNTEKFVDVARNEKDAKIRRFAIQRLGGERNAAAGDALVSIYTTEQDQDVKRTIIDALSGQRNAKALVAAAKAEKDSRTQQRIVERLVSIKTPESTEYLMEILKK